MDRKILERIIEAGTMAPSIDNCQPWFFAIGDSSVDIYLDVNRAQFFGDYEFTASCTTIGAVIENMSVAAAHEGFGSEVFLFPEKDRDNPVARMIFSVGKQGDPSLFPYIGQRFTDRYPYRKISLPPEILEKIKGIPNPEGASLFLFDDRDRIQKFFRISCLIDQIIFSHRELHANLFKWIRWDRVEAQRTRDGLPVDCLGLSWPERFFFRVISSWNRIDFLNRFGLNRLIGMKNSSLLLNSACIGFICMKESSLQDYVMGGRYFERLWLQATSMGLSLQPFGGLPFLLTRMIRGGDKGFSQHQCTLLQSAYRSLKEMVSLSENNALIGMFRLGHSGRTCSRSLRRPVAEVLLDRSEAERRLPPKWKRD